MNEGYRLGKSMKYLLIRVCFMMSYRNDYYMLNGIGNFILVLSLSIIKGKLVSLVLSNSLVVTFFINISSSIYIATFLSSIHF